MEISFKYTYTDMEPSKDFKLTFADGSYLSLDDASLLTPSNQIGGIGIDFIKLTDSLLN